MRSMPLRHALRSTVALGAVVLASAEAQAACTTSGNVVTCTGPNTTQDVNGAVSRTPPSSVSIVIADGATVTRGTDFSIRANNPPFSGAIGYTNQGVVGTTAANVDFTYFGAVDNPANSFTLDNRGTQNGRISAFNVGGTITATNSGTITRGVDLRGAGPIMFTNTGTVFNSDRFSTVPAITLISQRTTQVTGPDGILRTTQTGGRVVADISGPVAIPAPPPPAGTVPTGQNILINGIGGANARLNGPAGSVTVQSAGTDTAFRSTATSMQTQNGFTFTSTFIDDRRTLGTDATATVGTAGQVGNLFVVSGAGPATATVDGSVVRVNTGSTTTQGLVQAVSNGSDTTSRSNSSSVSVFANQSSTREQTDAQTRTNIGGAALAEVSATGRVAGQVVAFSNNSAATVRIAGTVGTASNTFSSAIADARGNDSSSQSRSTETNEGFNSPNRSSSSSFSSRTSASGDAATMVIASTGRLNTGAFVLGDTSATLDNTGTISGNVAVTSNRELTTASATAFAQSFPTNSATFATSSTNESVGGTADATNRVGAVIGGTLSVSGLTRATLDNAGAIVRGVSLLSNGTRTVFASEDRTTRTTTPATGGSITTIVQDGSSTFAARATGGTATGTYSGTVGQAASSGTTGTGGVTQNADTASTATVTGTIFGDFIGTAGSQNSDSTATFSRRETIQPNGASVSSDSNSSRDVTTQVASTSTLTVGPIGRILSNGFGGGNVTLDSAGGGANFTLDGGQIGGNVDVEAASGTNTTTTSSRSATFTRAASPTGGFVPEVQQSETGSETSDERQASGTATATINGGLISGNLTVRGSGSGVGTLGANVVQNGTVAGNMSAFATGIDERSSTTSTATRTGPSAVTRTDVFTTLSAPSGNAGGVLVVANGTTGGRITAGADTGSATVNLSGTAGSLSTGGVTVLSFDFTNRRETTTNFAGTDFFNLPPTSSTTLASTTVTGGTATLNVAPSVGTLGRGASSIEGDVFVQGFAGSTLNLAAGSQILQSAGRLSVGTGFFNSTIRTDMTFTGVQTGSTTTQTATLVGGPTTLTNAGVIGSATNQVAVNLFSVASTTATNTGTINGSVRARTQNANRSFTSVTTNIPGMRRTVETETLNGVGGPTSVNNAGLVTGGITVSGSTGLVTNSGVVRGAVTLGEDPLNFTRTTTTTTSATGAPVTTTTTTAPATLFAQTYTLNQNGLLVGGVNVAGTRSSNGAGGTIRTGSVNATVNLNNGSVTLGNITGNADATTNVNLNGSGFLGIAINDFLPRPVLGQPATAFSPAPALGRFTAIDPTIGTTANLPTGSRVSGVQTLTKSGDGTFVIVGSPLLPAFGTAPANFTLDVGTLRVNGGELQLGLAGVPGDAFGIRGNVENNANLVLGRRITNGAQSAVLGTNISVLGNVTNAATGNLVVGFNPSFVQSGSTLVPFVLGSPGLASTNSFLRVDGNLSLAGNVAVQGISGALYEAGRAQDLFSVSGTFANTGTVRSNFASPFVGFTLTPRSEGGRTIVSLGVVRNAFNTVTTDDNARAAADSFQAALPSIFGGIRSGANAADTQDLARIVTLLDTQLTADQANQVFRELSSGEFYGSLGAVSTTVPFGEATDGLTSSVGDDEAGEGKSGIGLWFRPTGQSAKFKRDDRTGASEIDVLNYGGSIGLNYSTGAGGSFGIAGGYGKLDVDATSPERAKADTIMVGIYAAQQFGGLHLSGQAVYGKSEWDVSRTLSLLGRRATASFDSEEIRANARIAYTIAPLPGLDISPFAKVEARRYDFDGFTETGAGAVSLVVAGRAKTIVSPEVGVRMAGAVGEVFRPFAEASYVFNGDVGSDRRMGFTGNRVQDFVTRGVDPQESIKGAIGVVADVALGTVFVRGDYASGGQQQVGSVRGGLLFKF